MLFPPIRTIPPVIWRNTLLFSAAQALAFIGGQMIPTLGALMIVQLVGTASLAGIASSISGISRLAASYPVGMLTDKLGRRGGLIIGVSIGIVGAIGCGLALIWGSFPLFLVSAFVFGMSMGASFQIRTAAADMYPPSRRAEGLGWVLTGSLVGALIAPLLIGVAEALAPGLGIDTLGFTWLLIPLTILPALALIAIARPDPRDIATDLDRYFPGASQEDDDRPAQESSLGLRAFLDHYPRKVALAASFATQGAMVMMMVMTALILSHEGHALHAISFSVALHVIGMFGFSLPLGRLADVLGRRIVMVGGVLVCMLGSLVVPLSADFVSVTVALFLIGIGWSAVNVASTALVADTTPPLERGRAIGTLDTLSSASAIGMPLLAGPVVELMGMPFLALIAIAVMVVPLSMLMRLRESSPGRYFEEVPAPA